jgi:hypothetical protein
VPKGSGVVTATTDVGVGLREGTGPGGAARSHEDTSGGAASAPRDATADTAAPLRIRSSTAATRTMLVLGLITATGALIRAQGFTRLGFFRDDAWVALSARQGFGTAVHMWVAAPGYFFAVRAFMLAGPGTTWWAQIPAFVAGVACIPAMYALSRHFRLSRVAGLVTAGVVSISPVAATYATRLKVYETDFLLSCVLLALAETTRRNPGRRQVTVLALGSVLAFVCSASVAAVIAGAWLMVAWYTLRRPVRPRHVVAGLGATVAGCGLVAFVAYAHVSPTIGLWWPDAFVRHSSPAAVVSSLDSVTWNLLAPLFGFPGLSTTAQVLVVVLGLALAVAALFRNAAMLGPALTLAVAYVASAAHRVPLGTGRTDLYLYPVVLLLMAAGAARLVRRARAVASDHVSAPLMLGAVAFGLASALLAGVLVSRAVAEPPAYPGVDVQAIAGAIAHQERPGDRIFVSELARFGWAEEVGGPITLRFGAQWAPGFTVVSRDPSVFLAPSEYLEGGSRPAAWAAAERRTHARRIWYVWSPPLAVFNPSFAALRADGWRPVRTLHATGISATLLVRP